MIEVFFEMYIQPIRKIKYPGWNKGLCRQIDGLDPLSDPHLLVQWNEHNQDLSQATPIKVYYTNFYVAPIMIYNCLAFFFFCFFAICVCCPPLEYKINKTTTFVCFPYRIIPENRILHEAHTVINKHIFK